MRKGMVAWRNFLLAGILSAAAVAAAGPRDCVEGERCRIKVLDARPTQTRVGKVEARLESDEIRAVKGKPKKLEKLLKKNAGMAVLGPEGKIYLVDGHHFATSLDMAGVDEMYVRIEKDWSDLPVEEFWRKMRKKRWAYLWDPQGYRVAAERLPATVRGLTDDPYRTLAWMVKQAGGIEDLAVPYQEFEWAKFFRRQGITIACDRLPCYRKAFAEAMPLVRKKLAENLPGYLGKEIKKRDGCGLRDLFDDLFVDD
jgi:hypothetical protein